MRRDTTFDLFAGDEQPTPGSFAAIVDGPPPVRTSDPDTSHAAARALDPVRRVSILTRILDALSVRPMTQFEVARATGLRPEQVHKRLSDLSRSDVANGVWPMIRDTGTRRVGDCGRLCIVWELAAAESSQ